MFRLPNANASVGESEIDLESVLKGAGGIVMFTCNHCPYVVASEERIESVASFAAKSGLGFVGINSNDPGDTFRTIGNIWLSVPRRCHIRTFTT